MASVLEMEGIGKRYEGRWILRDLRLTVSRGETVALFGGNGSGKTTLLKMIALLLPPTTGQFNVFGSEPATNSREIRTKIRFLGHEKRLYEALTVRENAQLLAVLRGLRDGRQIISVMERLGIEKFQNYRVSQLSEGMRKRLVLATLLLGSADLILLDEPHPTLDQGGKKILDDLIQQWKTEGKTLMIASHDHEQVLKHADRLVVLKEGKIFEEGKGC